MKRVATLVAAGFLLAGCGEKEKSDSDLVSETTSSYLSSLGNREYAKGCELLAASAKRDLIEYVSVQVPELGTTECESVFKQLIELTDEQALEALKTAKVSSVKVMGDTATAEVVGATQTAKLAKVEGTWRISELEFEDVSADAAPEAETPPAEEPVEPEAGADGGGAEAVALVRGRLEGAGYSVEDEEVSDEPAPDGALSVQLDGGAKMTVYLYSSYTDAARSEVQFDPVVKENPGQISVQSEGTNVYVGTVQEPAKLSMTKFRKAIAVAEGN